MRKIMVLMAVAVLTGAIPALADPGSGDGHKRLKLEMLDTDGNGMVSKDEFMVMHMKRFEKIDANADGNIAKDEIEAYRAARKAEREKMKADDQQNSSSGAPEEE